MKTEDVLLKMHPAHRSFIRDYIIIAVLLGSIYYVNITELFLNPIGLYAAISLSALIFIYVEISRLSNSYYVTKHQLIAKTGLTSEKIESVFLRNISKINLNQDLFHRIIDYGNITISSKGNYQICFQGISSPKKIVKQIEKLMKYDEGR